MTTQQTLIEGYFQGTGRKRLNHGSLKETKKSIISKDIVCLQKQQIQTEVNKPTTRQAKQAPAKKPRGKKLMQICVPPPATRSTRRNPIPATKETFSQLDNALANRKSPLKPSTPLSSGMKALTATRQEIPKVTSPIASYNTPTILKIPKNDPSTMDQVNKIRRKLMADLEQTNGKYSIPPLPGQAKVLSRAKMLAEPTKAELKQITNETLKPIECPSIESCTSPSKKDIIKSRLALLKTPEKSPKMREFEKLEFSSPTRSKRTNTTPIKPAQHQAAFHLASESQFTISLTHSILLEHFRCIDVVLSMVERRKESCTFEKLQRAVTTMSGKQFTLKNLSQIVYLYPTAFSLCYQPIRTSINSPRRGQTQLIIAANYDLHSESPIRVSRPIRSLSNQEQLIRKEQFHALIIKYISGHHLKFLHSKLPSIEISVAKIKRWHLDFDPNRIPAVPEGELPWKPQSNTPQTAKQILASSQELLPTRISRVMLKFTENNSNRETEMESETKEEVCDKDESKELKGISKNLIERIRIREQEKAKLSMVRDDKLIHKLDMLERLPEMCSIVRNMYLAEKRGTLPWADVVYKLKESHHSKMDHKYLEEHLTLLLEILPHWISAVTLKHTKYLKVQRNTPLNKLLADLGLEKARLETQ